MCIRDREHRHPVLAQAKAETAVRQTSAAGGADRQTRGKGRWKDSRRHGKADGAGGGLCETPPGGGAHRPGLRGAHSVSYTHLDVYKRQELWEAVRWAVKPEGAVLFFAQCPYDKILGASNLSMLRYEWVWYKSRCTGFLNARRAPLKKTENILVFYQKLPLYNPQFEQGKPYKKIASRCV